MTWNGHFPLVLSLGRWPRDVLLLGKNGNHSTVRLPFWPVILAAVHIEVTWSLPLLSWLPCVECGNGLSLQVSRFWGVYKIGRSGNVLEHSLSIPESLDCFVELPAVVHHHSFCGFVSVKHALSRIDAGLESLQWSKVLLLYLSSHMNSLWNAQSTNLFSPAFSSHASLKVAHQDSHLIWPLCRADPLSFCLALWGRFCHTLRRPLTFVAKPNQSLSPQNPVVNVPSSSFLALQDFAFKAHGAKWFPDVLVFSWPCLPQIACICR